MYNKILETLSYVLIIVAVLFILLGIFNLATNAQTLRQPRPPQLPKPQSGWEGQHRFDCELKEYRQQRDMVDQINRNTREINNVQRKIKQGIY